MKFFLALVIAILLLQAFAEASLLPDANDENEVNVVSFYKKHHLIKKKINCGVACLRRCAESSRKKVCHRACKACCHKCHCVPPGTYGHKNACPCYASLKTHGNKPKCP